MASSARVTRGVLYVIACGAPPARDVQVLVRLAQVSGWDVCVITTPSGAAFVESSTLDTLTGHPVRSTFKRPDDPDVLPPPDAIIVAPATFNTINKWALGIADTLALGILCEAVGQGWPTVVVPWLKSPLAAHPAFGRSVEQLRSYGVTVVDPAGDSLPWEHALRTLEQTIATA